MTLTFDQASSETLVPLARLAEEINVHHSTVWRWRTKGWRGYRLESIRFGEGIYTTREAFNRFLQRTNWVYAAHRPCKIK